MKLIFTKIWLTCTFFLYCFVTIGQVKFYADVSSEIINKDDFITYRIIIQNSTDVQQLTPPSLKGFNILSGPSQESGMTSINGRTTQYVALVYLLKPVSIGKIKIEPAKAIIGSKAVASNVITIVVKNALSGNNNNAQSPFLNVDPFVQKAPAADFSDYIFHKGDNVVEKVNKNMQLKLDVNRTSCYVGEPIIATYKLYTRLKSDSKLSQNPSFNGFSVVDIQQPGIAGYSTETLRGKEYNVYTIRKAQLYALQPGVINLESAELENDVTFIKEEYAKKVTGAVNLFDEFEGATFPPQAIVSQRVSLRSTPINITIKPLPEENKPISFNGAVGNFEINASLQKPVFSTDEAGKLTVTITGNGNMQLLTSPDIQWPAGIESFEPKFSEKLVKTTVPVSGNKKFEYSFSVNDSGHYTLPSISFSYFDPTTATYKEIATDPIMFQVTKGDGHIVHDTMVGIRSEKPAFINRIFYHRWWIIIFIGAVMLSVLIIWLIRERKSSKVADALTIAKEPDTQTGNKFEIDALSQKNVFDETQRCLEREDCIGFYALLNGELKQYLSERFSIDPNIVDLNSITAIMDKKGMPNDLSLQLQRLMHDLEWQLYTPFEKNEKMHEYYKEAQELVQRINLHQIRHL